MFLTFPELLTLLLFQVGPFRISCAQTSPSSNAS